MVGNGVGRFDRAPEKLKPPFVQQGCFVATPTFGVMHLGAAGGTAVALGIQTLFYPVQNNLLQARVAKRERPGRRSAPRESWFYCVPRCFHAARGSWEFQTCFFHSA